MDIGMEDLKPFTLLRMTILLSIIGGELRVTGNNGVQGLSMTDGRPTTSGHIHVHNTVTTRTNIATNQPRVINPVLSPLFPLSGQGASSNNTVTENSTTEQTTGHSTHSTLRNSNTKSYAIIKTTVIDNVTFTSTFAPFDSNTTTTVETPGTSYSNRQVTSDHSTARTTITIVMSHGNITKSTTGSSQANTSHGSNMTTTTAMMTKSLRASSRRPHTQGDTNTTQTYTTSNDTGDIHDNASVTASPTSEEISNGSGGDLYQYDDDKLWPMAAALSVSIPAVIVSAVTITVLYRRRMNKPRSFTGMYGNDYQHV